MDQIDRSIRQSGRRGGGGSNAALTTLAKESFDILTLLPNYIESTKTAVSELKQDTQVRKFVFLLSVEQFDHNREFGDSEIRTETEIEKDNLLGHPSITVSPPGFKIPIPLLICT